MYDIIIIGGGIAGSSAAIIAARNNKKVMVLDKGPQFGLLGTTSVVTDFPGFPEKISGVDLLANMHKQAAAMGVEIKTAGAVSCNLKGDIKRVSASDSQNYESKAVIFATGNMAEAGTTTYKGEDKYIGKGISYNVDSDAPNCAHQAVAIVGKDASVAEAAINLSNYAEKIYWIIPASKLDLSNDLMNKLGEIKRIEMFYSSSLKEINGSNELSSITILSAGREKSLNIKHLFLLKQLTYKPVISYLSGSGLEASSEGCIMVNQKLEASIQGTFAAGNMLCAKPQLNMVCAAQGAIAALSAANYISSVKG